MATAAVRWLVSLNVLIGSPGTQMCYVCQYSRREKKQGILGYSDTSIETKFSMPKYVFSIFPSNSREIRMQ